MGGSEVVGCFVNSKLRGKGHLTFARTMEELVLETFPSQSYVDDIDYPGCHPGVLVASRILFFLLKADPGKSRDVPR